MELLPEDAEFGPPLLEVGDDIRQEVAAPAVDAPHPPDPSGLRGWSPVDAMSDSLRLLHSPVYGTKEQLWKRLLEVEEVGRKEAAVQRELAAELEARDQGLSEKE